jgi:hypothetical protein
MGGQVNREEVMGGQVNREEVTAGQVNGWTLTGFTSKVVPISQLAYSLSFLLSRRVYLCCEYSFIFLLQPEARYCPKKCICDTQQWYLKYFP